MQQQLAQQKAVEAVQEATATDSSKRLQFKWAEKATSSNKTFQVKSLMQIQQEEQERIAKVNIYNFINICNIQYSILQIIQIIFKQNNC